MAMNAREQQRFKKDLLLNLHEAVLRLSTLQVKMSAALDKSNLDSLGKAKSKAENAKKPEDKHTIDQHEYALKELQSPLDALSKEMQDIVFGKELPRKYDSLVAIGDAHPMLFENGDLVFRREPAFVASLSSGGKCFYDMRKSYPNASMCTIAMRLPELCKYYAKVRTILTVPSMD